jgi:hypothetical protein
VIKNASAATIAALKVQVAENALHLACNPYKDTACSTSPPQVCITEMAMQNLVLKVLQH